MLITNTLMLRELYCLQLSSLLIGISYVELGIVTTSRNDYLYYYTIYSLALSTLFILALVSCYFITPLYAFIYVFLSVSLAFFAAFTMIATVGHNVFFTVYCTKFL